MLKGWLSKYCDRYRGYFQGFPSIVASFIVPQVFKKMLTLFLILQEPVNDAYTCMVASYHSNATL